jgi:hypothetical protein
MHSFTFLDIVALCKNHERTSTRGPTTGNTSVTLETAENSKRRGNATRKSTRRNKPRIGKSGREHTERTQDALWRNTARHTRKRQKSTTEKIAPIGIGGESGVNRAGRRGMPFFAPYETRLSYVPKNVPNAAKSVSQKRITTMGTPLNLTWFGSAGIVTKRLIANTRFPYERAYLQWYLGYLFLEDYPSARAVGRDCRTWERALGKYFARRVPWGQECSGAIGRTRI